MFSHTLLRNEHHVERSSSDVRGTRKGVSERQPTPLKQLADVGEDKSISWNSGHQVLPEKRAELIIHSDMRSIK